MFIQIKNSDLVKVFVVLSFLLLTGENLWAQAEKSSAASDPIPEVEDDFYKMISLPVPDDIILEVGGMVTLPNGSLAICTR